MRRGTIPHQVALALVLVLTMQFVVTGFTSAKPDKPSKVTPLDAYSVEVSCVHDAGSDTSACTFTATGPKGKGKVKVLYLPTSLPCTEGAVTDAEQVTVGQVTTYASRKNKPTVTVQLPGEVSSGSTATYWVEAGKRLLPAVGPGLICTKGKAEGPEEPAPTATEPPTQGSVLVSVLTCSDDAGGDEFDWYGECATAAEAHRFQLAPTSGGEGVTSATDEEGKVTFSGLESGTYGLTLADGNWCHAESDSVDSEGGVIVRPGEQSSVWIFVCGG